MDLKNISDANLLQQTSLLVREERSVTTRVLHHLREIERRRLFALGYQSLFDYCVRGLHYSESSAQRRIEAMRLLKEMPEIEEKIESGELSLSVVAQAQRFFRHEAADKKEVLKALEGKSAREAEKELLSRSSEPAVLKRPESVKPVSATLSEVKFLADQEFCQDLAKLRGLFPDLSLSELMKKMLKLTLEKFDPAQQKSKNPRKIPASAMNKKTRYIKASVKQEVWKRDEGRCTHCDPLTGERCKSQHRLEVDHIHPFALGGDNSAENLRLLCAHHNKWQAGQIFGQEKMNQYAKK